MLDLTAQIIRLVLAVGIGGLVGIEREVSHKPAGLRTHILVCLGSTLATIISTYYYQMDPARIAAAIITGIGFVGAGAIIASGKQGVHGVTTAATIWITAAIGITIGVGAYALALFSAVLVMAVLGIASICKKKAKQPV